MSLNDLARRGGLAASMLCLIALFTVVALRESSQSATTGGVDPHVYAAHMEYRLDRLDDILPIFREHQEQYRVMTPIGFQLFQPFRPDPVPVSFDTLPKSFVNGLVGEHRMATVVYPIIIMEDPDTRYVHIFNAENQHIYSLPPESDYDHTPHLTAMPWLFSAPPEVREYWRAFHDPSRVAMKATLIDESDLGFHLYARARVEEEQRLAQQALFDDEGDGGFMMMSMGTESNIVITSIQALTNGIQVEIGYPETFTNRLEIFRATSLMERDWRVESSPLTTLGTNAIAWVHDYGGTSPFPSTGFYAAGNYDQDSDGDGISDAREIFVYKSDPLNPDTSGDGMDDGTAVEWGFEPLLSNVAVQVWIDAPLDGRRFP